MNIDEMTQPYRRRRGGATARRRVLGLLPRRRWRLDVVAAGCRAVRWDGHRPCRLSTASAPSPTPSSLTAADARAAHPGRELSGRHGGAGGSAASSGCGSHAHCRRLGVPGLGGADPTSRRAGPARVFAESGTSMRQPRGTARATRGGHRRLRVPRGRHHGTAPPSHPRPPALDRRPRCRNPRRWCCEAASTARCPCATMSSSPNAPAGR